MSDRESIYQDFCAKFGRIRPLRTKGSARPGRAIRGTSGNPAGISRCPLYLFPGIPKGPASYSGQKDTASIPCAVSRPGIVRRILSPHPLGVDFMRGGFYGNHGQKNDRSRRMTGSCRF
jgi:hypothetical protein